MGVHGPAAARTAVTDGVKTTEHGIFEEGVVDVPALVFSFQNFNRFFWRDPPAAFRLVLDDETGKRFANDQADIHWQAGMFAGSPAGAVEHHDVIRVVQDDIAGAGIGDHFFQIADAYFLLDAYQLARRFKGNHLAVVGLGKFQPAWGNAGQRAGRKRLWWYFTT